MLDKLGRRNEAVKAWERALALEGSSEELPAKLKAARAGAAPTADAAKVGAP